MPHHASWRASAAAAACVLLLLASACNAQNTNGATNPDGSVATPGFGVSYAARSARPEVVGEGRFRQADCDKDGLLNRVEVDAFVYAYTGLGEGFYVPISGAAWPDADLDKNNQLTPAELDTFISQKATGGWEYYPIDCANASTIRTQ